MDIFYVMKLFKKRCAHCHVKLDEGKEIFAEVKLPQFIDSKVKTFCNEEHHKTYLMENQGTPSRKPYCMNCDD
jgi:hypothetical protein